ncbi:MAG: hypothetical protein A4E53_04671 [Pelotomaculum sp. PtaB.Bin104]|nr:MAG: hypothetical protein A4E53_04671 [Pelotomaculum sp. PtaB.Bin104]
MAYENIGDTMRICRACNHSNFPWSKYCNMCGASLFNEMQNPSQANIYQQCQSPQSQQSYHQHNSKQDQAQGNMVGYVGLGMIKLVGRISAYIYGLFKFIISTVRIVFFAAKLLILIIIVYLIFKLFGFFHSDSLNLDKLISLFYGFASTAMSGIVDLIIKIWK